MRAQASADIDQSALIGDGTHIWHLAQVREDARIGNGCIIGRGAYIDKGVVLGDNCKIQNFAMVYAPARLGRGVFIGPGAIVTNDRHPRAVAPDGHLKTQDDWTPEGVSIGDGASIGAGAVLLPGITIGDWSLIAAGSVVTRDVPAHALVGGVTAKLLGWVSKTGRPLEKSGSDEFVDAETGWRYILGEGRLEAVE